MKNRNVTTITLNPAFDMHYSIENFRTGKENFVQNFFCDAGGKGVNISRALLTGDVKNTAIILLGKNNAKTFIKSIKEQGIKDHKIIFVKGNIRENITIHDPFGKETRISFNGSEINYDFTSKLLKLTNRLSEGDVLTLTGSLANGIDINNIKNFLAEIKKRGVKIVIDSRSFSVKDLTDIKPWLIKPNEQEILSFIKKDNFSLNDLICVSNKLCYDGIENVMISLGKEGAILNTGNKIFRAETPQLEIVSTIGAGDSTIAGFIVGYVNGLNTEKSFKKAIAFGSSACLTLGTNPPLKSDIANVEKEVKVFEITE